jgi:hypothetical protein
VIQTSSSLTHEIIVKTCHAIFERQASKYKQELQDLVFANATLTNGDCSLTYKNISINCNSPLSNQRPFRKVQAYNRAHYSLIDRLDSYIAETNQFAKLQHDFTNYLTAGHRTVKPTILVCIGFESWLEPYLDTKRRSYAFDTPESHYLADLFKDTVQLTKEHIVRNMLE